MSTDNQNLDLQRDALMKVGCTEIYEEKASGESVERIELDRCLRAPRIDNALSVWRLDRLGEPLPDLVRIVDDLESRGVAFESISEKIEKGSAAGKLVFHVSAALSEFERNLIRERTHAGLSAARARGRTGGRKPKLDAKQIRETRALLKDPDVRVIDVAKRYGVSRATVHKHVGAVMPGRSSKLLRPKNGDQIFLCSSTTASIMTRRTRVLLGRTWTCVDVFRGMAVQARGCQPQR